MSRRTFMATLIPSTHEQIIGVDEIRDLNLLTVLIQP